MSNRLGQSPIGDSFYPCVGPGGLQVVFKPGKPSSQIRLVRFLLSKWIVEGSLNTQERATLVELYFSLRRQKDLLFRRKHQRILSDLEAVLPSRKLPVIFDKIYLLNTGGYPPWFLGIHSMSGYFGEVRNLAGIKLARVIRRIKRLPPKPYIGRGYTDKGNRRVVSMDGSPSWQEVASGTNLSKAYEQWRGSLPHPDSLAQRKTGSSQGTVEYRWSLLWELGSPETKSP